MPEHKRGYMTAQAGILDAIAAHAVELVPDGARVGLGTGRAATAFIRMLGSRVRQGLRVSGVPTSMSSERVARESGVPLIELSDEWSLDLTVDGADEVAPNLDLLKGRGGAMVRERIVAFASLRQVILVGHEKLVAKLGQLGVPLEVVPFGLATVLRELARIGHQGTVRTHEGSQVTSENGNVIVDCAAAPTAEGALDPAGLEKCLLAIPGVVDTGLFLGTAERVLVGYPDGRVETLRRGVV